MVSLMCSASTGESFPRQSARTQRFTAGAPRAFTITADGGRVLFLRSRHGTDRVGCLWSLDVGSGEERLLVDPVVLGEHDEELSVAERARRERAREASAGIVGYATDADATVAAFALSSRLWVADLATGSARELPAVGPVLDPRPDPTGTWVAYGGAGALRLTPLETAPQRVRAGARRPPPRRGTRGVGQVGPPAA